MANPGSIGSAMLDSEDTQGRKIADLAREVRELGPSVARSFATTVQKLDEQIAFLASLKTVSATDSSVSWVVAPFAPKVDSGASVTVTTAEALQARVSYTAQVFVATRGGTSAYSRSFYVGAVALNGVQIGSDSIGGISAGPGGDSTSEFAYSCDRIVTVPAGVNVFTHQYRAFSFAASGGETSGDRAEGVLVVQFIGRP